MNFLERYSGILAVVAIVIAIIVGVSSLGGGSERAGGITNYDQVDAADGFSVDGTTVITGAGVITGTTGSMSGLLTLDGGTLKSSTNSTSTTATSYTFVQADLLNYDTMLMTPNVGDLTLTLTASSSLTSLVPNTGDTYELAIVNASTTAGIDITLAGGTGTLLRKATTTATILANSVGILQFIRKANTDIIVFFINAVQ